MRDKFDSISIPIDVSTARQHLILYFLFNYLIPLTIISQAIGPIGFGDFIWVWPVLLIMILYGLGTYFVFKQALEKEDVQDWEYLMAVVLIYPSFIFQWPAYYFAKRQYSSTYESYFTNLDEDQYAIGKYVSKDNFIRICRNLDENDPILGIFKTVTKRPHTVILRRSSITINLDKEITMKYEEIDEFYIKSDVLTIQSGLKKYDLSFNKEQIGGITEILAVKATNITYKNENHGQTTQF